MWEIVALMNDEQKVEWERLTSGRDIYDSFTVDQAVRILTDCPPDVNPMFTKYSKANSILRKNNYPEITIDVLGMISRFATSQNFNINPWAMSLWYLAVKYGYDKVEDILNRVETENVEIYEISTIVKIVHFYDEMKEYPLKWIIKVI